MRLYLKLILIVGSLLAMSFQVLGQPPSTAERLEKLRLQLADTQSREESLRKRVAQLEEDLKPENIERSLAGFGSTKPEELREHRRRQLTIERDGVLAQLKTLESGRLRLEAAIADAEVRVYQESASPSPQLTAQTLGVNTLTFTQAALLLAGAALLMILGTGILIRRRHS